MGGGEAESFMLRPTFCDHVFGTERSFKVALRGAPECRWGQEGGSLGVGHVAAH